MEDNLLLEKEKRIKQLELEVHELDKLISNKQTTFVILIILGFLIIFIWIVAYLEYRTKEKLIEEKRKIDKELKALVKEVREIKINELKSKYTKEQFEQFDILDGLLNKQNKKNEEYSNILNDIMNSFKNQPSLITIILEINELVEKKIINVSKENFDIWKEIKLKEIK